MSGERSDSNTLGRGDPFYLPNQQLRQRLVQVVRTQLEGRRRSLVLVDVGAGEKPYIDLFAPYVSQYIALDYAPRRQSTSVAALAEQLPLNDQSVDVVLATQMLEHVSDPASTIAEWRRVLRQSGLVFLSTHGTFPYHPDPTDYWRWTHAGLAKLMQDGGLTIHSLEACGGNLSTYTALLASDGATRANKLGMARPFAAAVNVVNMLVERLDPPVRVRQLSESFHGGLPMNYVVVAEKHGPL